VYYVYILKLHDQSIYVGFSRDIKKRLKEHQSGCVESTKNIRPIKLVFYCAFDSIEKALKFESYLKSSSGFAFRNKRLV